MSNRRENAKAAGTADHAANTDRALADFHRASNGGAITEQEKRDERDGLKAGMIYRLRLSAASIVENVATLRADGVTVSDDAYRMPEWECTGERGPHTFRPFEHGGREVCPVCGADAAQLDALAVLSAWQDGARAGRGYGLGMRDRSRMVESDLTALGAYGANVARRMTRGKMDADTVEDIGANVRLAILERGGVKRSDCAMPGCGAPAAYKSARKRIPGVITGRMRVRLCFKHAAPYTDRRPLLPNERYELPRWDTLKAATADEAPQREAATREVGITARNRMVADYSTADRSRWRGFTYLEARRQVGAWRERINREQAADWTDAGEDAPTDEQLRARASEVAHAASEVLLERVAEVAAMAHFMAATAPGKPLGKAERDAVSMALTGMKRQEIAAARGVTTEFLKLSANRGRKSLATRVEASDVATWVRAASVRMARITYAPTEHEQTARVMDRALAAKSGAPYWRSVAATDRIAQVTGDDYVIPRHPNEILSVTTRANLPGGGWSREWTATDRPRARWTATGWSMVAPAVLSRTATALTTYRRRYSPSTLDTSAAVTVPPREHRIGWGHPAPSREIAAMRRQTATQRAAADKWCKGMSIA